MKCLRELKAKSLSYLLAAPLPHSFTLLATAVILYLFRLLLVNSPNETGLITTLAFPGLLIALGVILCSFTDGLCRYQEYKRFKQAFSRFGFRLKLLKINSSSRCQRDALLQAARETGISKEVRQHFLLVGYRWYHILPDQILTNPRILFDPKFLRATFWPG